MQLHSESLNFYYLFYKVRKKLSETTAGFWSDLEIYSALNEGQQHIARKSKCLRKEVPVTTDGSQTYGLIDNDFSDIIDIDEDGVYFYVNGTSYQPLHYKTKSQLNKEFPGWQGVSASTPQYFYYNKSTKTIGLYPKCNSSNQGEYLFINGYYRPKILIAGTASSGSTTTLVMPAGTATLPYPNPTNDYYNDLYVEIYSGTGAGQKLKITDYVGLTRTLTFATATAPDNTSVFGFVPEVPEEAHNLICVQKSAIMI